MRRSEDFVKIFVEIPTGKEKVRKNGKMNLFFFVDGKKSAPPVAKMLAKLDL